MFTIFYIIIIFFIALLFLPLLFISGKNKLLKHNYNNSVGFVKYRLGSIISINGPIRVGKTSAQAGISSIMEKLIIQDILELMEKTKLMLKSISFNKLDYILNDYYSNFDLSDKDNYPIFEDISNVIITSFNLNEESFINDFIGNIPIDKLIIDYCQAYFVIYFRNNYIQSKTPFYSHTTGNYNLDLDVNWLSIKNAYKNKDYAILDWVVILIDELTDEASSGMWQQDLQDLSGAKDYRRKFGQIHQERNKIISTKQDVLDEIKKFRNLTHSHLHLDHQVYTIGNYNVLYNFIDSMFRIKHFLFKNLYLKPKFYIKKILRIEDYKQVSFSRYYDYFLNESNMLRKDNNYLFYLKEFLLSIGFNVYNGRVLERAEDIEKANAESEIFTLTIPTIDCWGVYDTHLFKSMQTDLLDNSNTIAKEVIPIKNESFFEETYIDSGSSIKKKGVDRFEF